MAQITVLSLHVIDQVKIRRLCLGMSAERLSILIERSHGYVLTVENSNLQSQYPPHEWPKIAEVLGCTVHDLLPVEQTNSTGEFVDKVVLSLSSEEDMARVLDGLIAHGFFAQRRTIAELGKYLFIEKAEQLSILERAITLFTETGRIKLDQDGFVY